MAEKAEKVDKAEKGSKSDRIWQMARSLFEARPAVSDRASEPPALSFLPENPAVRGSTFPPAQSVPPAQWLSDPTSIEPGFLARQLLKAMPALDSLRQFCTEQHGATDLPGRFTELIVALRAYGQQAELRGRSPGPGGRDLGEGRGPSGKGLESRGKGRTPTHLAPSKA